MITYSTWSPEIPERCNAAEMANPPRSIAVNDFNAPDSLPIGVRAPPTITEPGMIFLSAMERSEGFDLEARVLRAPHGLVHLLDRVVEGHLGQALLDGGAGDRDGHSGRDRPQVTDGRQQRGARAGGVGQLRDGVRRGRDHAVA